MKAFVIEAVLSLLVENANSCIPNYRMKSHPEIWLHPKCMYLEISVKHNILIWQNLQIKTPKHFGYEQFCFVPCQSHARTRPGSLTEREKALSGIIFESRCPIRMIFWQPTLRSIAARLLEVARASRESKVAVLNVHLI